MGGVGDGGDDGGRVLCRHERAPVHVHHPDLLAVRRQLQDGVEEVLFGQGVRDARRVGGDADDPPRARFDGEGLCGCHGGVCAVKLGEPDMDDPGLFRGGRPDP